MLESERGIRCAVDCLAAWGIANPASAICQNALDEAPISLPTMRRVRQSATEGGLLCRLAFYRLIAAWRRGRHKHSRYVSTHAGCRAGWLLPICSVEEAGSACAQAFDPGTASAIRFRRLGGRSLTLGCPQLHASCPTVLVLQAQTNPLTVLRGRHAFAFHRCITGASAPG